MTEEIGRYKVLRRLGAGGMAEVFLASFSGDEGFEKRVAIKRILPDWAVDPARVQAFADEARLVAQLSHPNIVQVFSFEHDGTSHYLVMEYVDGLPLSRAVQLGRGQSLSLGSAAVVDVGIQVCDGLAYAHAATTYDGDPMHIVHRDIKPANLMLTPRGQVKITDFGVARATTNLHHTITGSGKGTLAYMAPEQLDGRLVGPPADLFALGTVLFELATGEFLFEPTELALFMERRREGVREQDIEKLSAVAPELVEVAQRCLALDPADRYGDAEEMGQALRELPVTKGRQQLNEWVNRLTLTEVTLDGSEPSVSAGGGRQPTLADAVVPLSGGGSVPPTVTANRAPGLDEHAPTAAYRPPPSETVVDSHPAVQVTPPPDTAAPAAAPSRLYTVAPWVLLAAVVLVALLVIWKPWDGDPEPAVDSTPSPTETTPSPAESTPDDGRVDTEPPPLLEAPVERETPSPADDVTPSKPRTELTTFIEPPTPTEPPTPAQAELATEEEPPATPEVTGTGTITITTDPWAIITVDGAVAGQPGRLVKHPLPLGSHTIKVSNPNEAIADGSLTVELEQKGEAQTWRFEIRDGAWAPKRLQ